MKQLSTGFAGARRAAILIAAISLVSLSACQTKSTYDTHLETAVPLTSSDLPADIKLVAAAVSFRMKGYGPNRIPHVTFAPATGNIQEAGFNYEGFVVKGISVVGYGNRPDGRPGKELGAVLLFEDSVGRRTTVRLLAHYAVSGNGIQVDHASITPVFPAWANAEAYIVPRAALPANPRSLIRNHADLYSFAVSNAIRPGSATNDGRNLVFLFAKDRASPTATLKGKVSDDKTGTSGYEGGTKILDYAGWRAASIAGQFDVNGNAMLFAKPVYRPGEEQGFFARGDRLLGSFGLTSRALRWGLGTETGQRKIRPAAPAPQVATPQAAIDPKPATGIAIPAKPARFSPAQAYQPPPPQAYQQPPPQAIQAPPPPAPGALDQAARSSGMISNGLVLLDLAAADDARQVKLRLGELGYFNGNLAGAWNPLAQAALLRFTQDVKLRVPGAWNAETQMVLFAGSGK
jgi:hypothetical protein